MVKIKSIRFRRVILRKPKMSLAFKYGLFLVAYSLIYYYCYSSTGGIISQLLTFLGFLVSVGVVLFTNCDTKLYHKSIIVVLMFISMLVSNILNNPNLGGTVTCLMMLSGLYIFSEYKLTRNETELLTFAFIIFVIAILLNCNIGNEFYEGKFNPNSGGFVLALLFCVLLTWFLYEKKVLMLLGALICLALQVVYISRTALICCLCYLLLSLLFKTSKKLVRAKTVQKMIIFLGVFGLLVAFVYSKILFENIGYGKLVIFGKDLFTGREVIWKGAIDSLIKNPIFGVGGDLNVELAEQSGNPLMSNAHNQPLGLAVAFGLPVFFAYYYLLSKCIISKNKRLPATIVTFFSVILIMSCFDVYFFAVVNTGPILISYCIIKNCHLSRAKK